MTHDRLHALTDGIFAIVMTLLVLELKVPLLENASNKEIWHYLTDNSAIFLSYIMSFVLLFIYWRAHNFIISMMAKNLDMKLVSLNMIFLLLIGIVPFTTHLLGEYPELQIAITIYSANIIFIGLMLWSMRHYVETSDTIEHERRTHDQKINAYIRMLTPVALAFLAIPLSFINTWIGFGLLLLSVVFNLPPNSADIFRRIFRI